jgi:hypothetical protein
MASALVAGAFHAGSDYCGNNAKASFSASALISADTDLEIDWLYLADARCNCVVCLSNVRRDDRSGYGELLRILNRADNVL